MLENGGKILLQTYTGLYFGREERGYIVAKSWKAKESDYFTVHSESDGKVTLQADNGKYLSRQMNGGMWYIVAVSDSPVDSSYFKVYDRDEGDVSLKADNGLFLMSQVKWTSSGNVQYLVARFSDMNGYNCKNPCKLSVEFL